MLKFVDFCAESADPVVDGLIELFNVGLDIKNWILG